MNQTHEIFSVIEKLKAARQAESDCELALADARAATERRKSITLATGYQSGAIAGKNQDERKTQEAQLLEASQPVHEAELLCRQLESKHTAARIEREYEHDRYRAMLALMQPHAETLTVEAAA